MIGRDFFNFLSKGDGWYGWKRFFSEVAICMIAGDSESLSFGFESD